MRCRLAPPRYGRAYLACGVLLALILAILSLQSVAAAECVGEDLQCALLEPAEFLYDHCVQSAKEGLEAVLRAFPPASFLSEQPYYSSPVHAGEPSGHSRSGATGLSLLQRTQEGVAAAAALARSWDNGRQVRGTMFLHTVLRAASTLAQEVRTPKCLYFFCFFK